MPTQVFCLYNSFVKTWDVIIVGGGIIGLSLAIALRKRSLSVLVVERGEPGREASHDAGGMLVDCPLETAPPLQALATASARMYPEFVHELEVESGMKVDLRDRGTILFPSKEQLGHPALTGPELRPCAVSLAQLEELEPALHFVRTPADDAAVEEFRQENEIESVRKVEKNSGRSRVGPCFSKSVVSIRARSPQRLSKLRKIAAWIFRRVIRLRTSTFRADALLGRLRPGLLSRPTRSSTALEPGPARSRPDKSAFVHFPHGPLRGRCSTSSCLRTIF
jgi:choline dehydrogenase-like flavoprotein